VKELRESERVVGNSDMERHARKKAHDTEGSGNSEFYGSSFY
jgi:hypothetical protein